MSQDLLKTITVSLTSSFCTALFVVACTAGADSKTAAPSLGDAGSGGVDDPGDDGDGVDAATLAALELRVAELEDFQSSSLCFIGHMTDDSSWEGYTSPYWRDIDSEARWDQGPNSDATKAYEDCF